jgi:Mg-chelatase subunit ChlD
VPQPPTVALEANPNADLQALPPEAILSPSPAPHLNGHDAVVFILDVSGSMYEPYAGSTRLAFARETLCRRISALKNGAPFAVTLYAERARNSGPLVAASAATREAARRFVMEDVDCGGGTNLPEGLASARQLDPGRLVVVTDGDLNMNLPELLTKSRAILGPAGHGPALTVIGIDPRARSGDEEVLKSIADQQGGAYLREHVASSAELLTANRNQSATTGTP